LQILYQTSVKLHQRPLQPSTFAFQPLQTFGHLPDMQHGCRQDEAVLEHYWLLAFELQDYPD
jgi:hypothetical protein